MQAICKCLSYDPGMAIIKWFKLCIKVAAGEDQVMLFHQAFAKWYQKVREVDIKATLYPWATANQLETPLLIKNLTDIQTTLPLIKVCPQTVPLYYRQ